MKNNILSIPALIDPHVHFRTPGQEYKENWVTGSRAALAGGFTTVFDMPNNDPSCVTKEALQEKKALIEEQLKESGLPLRYHLYFGADKHHLEEIPHVREEVIGLKIYMGSSTGNLLMDDEESLEKAFRICAENDLIIAVHAENEQIIRQNQKLHFGNSTPSIHSTIRSHKAAFSAVKQAIDLAEKYDTRLYIVHVSTKGEIELIREAKEKGLSVYCEVTPHHLFFTVENYQEWGTMLQMNPPIRKEEDINALWEGIRGGTVDTIGTDHAPHTIEEKQQPYGKAPSGVPGLETALPLLLNAHHQGKISIEKIISLTSKNIEKIFRLEPTGDLVHIDLDCVQHVDPEMLMTKCRWSPFAKWELKGWPIKVILKGKDYTIAELKEELLQNQKRNGGVYAL